MIKEGMSDSDAYNRLLSWVDKKEAISNINATDLKNLDLDVNSYITGVKEAPFDWDTLRKDIISKKALNETGITRANEKYKYWAGRYFADATFGQETEDELIWDDGEEDSMEGEHEDIQESVGEPVKIPVKITL